MSTSRTEGRIATPDRRATLAGEDILAHGGSAVDAVIAASAVLCVVYPQMVTIGGDTWTLVGETAAAAVAVNGTGRAPLALNADIIRNAGFAEMPGMGVHAITVPGLMAAWQDLHDRYGRLPMADLLARARDYAEEGTPVAPSLARDLASCADSLSTDPGCRQVFFDGSGTILREGSVLRQPALAQTLRTLAEQGIDAFYGGDLGRDYVRGLAALGSTLTATDLSGHRTDFLPPLCRQFKGHQVLTAPPSSQGFTLLKLLAMMEVLAVGDPLRPDQVVEIGNSAALAGSERDAVSADPETVPVDVDRLLDRELVVRQASALRTATTPDELREPWTSDFQPLGGDTVGLVAVDAHGQWVSSVQSVAGTLGAHVLEPATGILAHNRGGGFSLDPAAPGYLVGGRRPPHTLMPCLVRRDGRIVASIATMGGRSQPIIVAQLLCRLLCGDDAQTAAAAPRWVVQPGFSDRLEVLAERTVGVEVLAALERAFAVTVVDGPENRFGQGQLIWRTDGALQVGTDPRADGLQEPT